MPAGYMADGSRIASLREVLAPEIATKPLGELSHTERTELALRRLRAEPHDVRLRMLGVRGVLNKKRIIAEIEASSHIGMHLVDIEMRFIRMLVEQG